MTNEMEGNQIVTLERMRHMPLSDLAKLEHAALEDLRAKAAAALVDAKEIGSLDLIFSVQLAKSWIECAVRFKLAAERGGDE